MKHKLLICVLIPLEVESSNYDDQPSTPEAAAEEEQKLWEDGSIDILDYLANAENVVVRIVAGQDLASLHDFIDEQELPDGD